VDVGQGKATGARPRMLRARRGPCRGTGGGDCRARNSRRPAAGVPRDSDRHGRGENGKSKSPSRESIARAWRTPSGDESVSMSADRSRQTAGRFRGASQGAPRPVAGPRRVRRVRRRSAPPKQLRISVQNAGQVMDSSTTDVTAGLHDAAGVLQRRARSARAHRVTCRRRRIPARPRRRSDVLRRASGRPRRCTHPERPPRSPRDS
jgi:hypothetical protein